MGAVKEKIDYLRSVKSTEEFARLLDKIVSDLGFSSYSFGMSFQPAQYEANVFFLSNAPEIWQDSYRRSRYIEIDPRVTHAFSMSPMMGFWNRSFFRQSLRLKRFYDEAHAYRIRSGMTAAGWSAGAVYAINLNADEIEIPKHLIHQGSEYGKHLLHCAQEVALRFHEPPLPKAHYAVPAITLRETQCLTWASQGKTSWEISMILGITCRTVNFHFYNLKAKLDVANRQQAIAKGIILGIVKPNVVKAMHQPTDRSIVCVRPLSDYRTRVI